MAGKPTDPNNRRHDHEDALAILIELLAEPEGR